MLLLIQTEFFLAYILQYISDMLVYLFDKGQDVTMSLSIPNRSVFEAYTRYDCQNFFKMHTHQRFGKICDTQIKKKSDIRCST